MARPGLKVPPRHAVVVRGGEAPESEHIPVARPSVPPPPASEPAPVDASERITLRAIPTPSSPPPPNVEPLPPPSEVPQSAGPLSDAPVAASARAAGGRRRGSSWAIGLAVAAGLLLGSASVVMRARAPASASQPPVVAPSRVGAEQPAAARPEAATGDDASAPSALPTTAPSSEPAASASGRSAAAKPGVGHAASRPQVAPRQDGTASKRNIF